MDSNILKSPEDARDWKYSELSNIDNLSLPKKLDLRKKLKPVRNQGGTRSCVAFAAACIKEYQEYKNNGLMEYMSPLFIYNNRSNTGTTGMYSRDLFRILSNIGVVAEKDYSIKKHYNDISIPKELLEKAENFKISGYARIYTTEELKMALYKNGPCQVVLPDYTPFGVEFWKKYKEDQPLLGGHDVVCVGYDDEKRKFILRNSKGKNWGDRGYTYIDYDEYEKVMWETWTIIDDESSIRIKDYLYEDQYFKRFLLFLRKILGYILWKEEWIYY